MKMLATPENPFVCSFRENEHGRYFEVFQASPNPFNMPHIIDVNHGQTRFGRVLKTVAYVVVDEGPDMTPITEKWNITRL